MLSMQIDRLRSCADLYDGTMKPEMAKELQRPYLAQELREAADTIWELRDDLQRANAENAKLRECLQDLAEHIREDDGFGLDYGWMLDRMRELGVDA